MPCRKNIRSSKNSKKSCKSGGKSLKNSKKSLARKKINGGLPNLCSQEKIKKGIDELVKHIHILEGVLNTHDCDIQRASDINANIARLEVKLRELRSLVPELMHIKDVLE